MDTPVVIDVRSILELLACPSCGGPLSLREEYLISGCGKRYSIKNGKAYFSESPGDFEQDGDGPNVVKKDWGPWRKHNFDYFKEGFKPVPDSAAVLDLGAGPGQFSELTGRFSSFVSMDFRAFRPTNVIADLTKLLPLLDGSVDVVMASNVLEHIPDTRSLLDEVHRVLKPEGIFIATIPFLMRVHQKPYDFNRYTKYQLEALLAEAGFQESSVSALSAPFEVYATMQRHFYITELARAKGIKKLIMRVFRFSDRGRGALLRAVASGATSDDYTEGYGLTAYKR